MSDPMYLKVDAGVRYWEDTRINGEWDFDGAAVPFRNGARWQPVIRLFDGVVMDWPKGMTAKIYYKICDDGEYFLQEKKDGYVVSKYNGDYVPDKFLCHGDDGFGDYIIMSIDGNGAIRDYRRPSINTDEWSQINE